jgi:hypothetical protein
VSVSARFAGITSAAQRARSRAVSFDKSRISTVAASRKLTMPYASSSPGDAREAAAKLRDLMFDRKKLSNRASPLQLPRSSIEQVVDREGTAPATLRRSSRASSSSVDAGIVGDISESRMTNPAVRYKMVVW